MMIPKEIEEKMKEATDKEFPIQSMGALSDSSITIIANQRGGFQMGFIAGYSLGQSAIQELKNKLEISKNCWRSEMTDRMAKEAAIQELCDELSWALSELEPLNDETKQLESINEQLPLAKQSLQKHKQVWAE